MTRTLRSGLFGLLLTTLVAVAIVLTWQYGFSYVDGTPFEELRYVIFGLTAIGVLSGLDLLLSKLRH
ncbi:hypothetical protein OSJ77_03700 [Phyllobacterium sp. 0TCS1.6C]|uniref:hypothetical protein n=1 Tax=unclassified Phyllobacterium TaxID=2638441 RepID=UPI0022645A23|nr:MULTISPECIES: hypothetical protein [unclassified Phyllobacterium]MCX8279279.1 hypothetical protein [Phyllobacterium sp. 0TCS1.6C]MCX8294063.1 hypothetical protein [Phyllobacterium sp. 0TCS1.6A]